MIDREAQRNWKSYTGIAGIHLQDQAITESMGAIYDRTQEHLGTSDAMVIRTRRRVINAAEGAARQRRDPAGRRRSDGLSPPLRRRDPAAERRLARRDEGAAPRVRPAHAGGGCFSGDQHGRLTGPPPSGPPPYPPPQSLKDGTVPPPRLPFWHPSASPPSALPSAGWSPPWGAASGGALPPFPAP